MQQVRCRQFVWNVNEVAIKDGVIPGCDTRFMTLLYKPTELSSQIALLLFEVNRSHTHTHITMF